MRIIPAWANARVEVDSSIGKGSKLPYVYVRVTDSITNCIAYLNKVQAEELINVLTEQVKEIKWEPSEPSQEVTSRKGSGKEELSFNAKGKC